MLSASVCYACCLLIWYPRWMFKPSALIPGHLNARPALLKYWLKAPFSLLVSNPPSICFSVHPPLLSSVCPLLSYASLALCPHSLYVAVPLRLNYQLWKNEPWQLGHLLKSGLRWDSLCSLLKHRVQPNDEHRQPKEFLFNLFFIFSIVFSCFSHSW